ncbi:MAG: aminotransferase DegT [Betaproteobacteria bacterium]|nr:aminotransferase DegT [Betaproteobacteria bacterium]
MNTARINAVLPALESVLGKPRAPIALHEPKFEGREWDYVKECLDTGWVSSAGKFVDRFESMLTEYTGAKFAIATVNGTSALHICLQLVGVQSGDEVLTPALTFIASANAVSYCNAIPHLVDSSENTLGLDPEKLRGYLRSVSEFRNGRLVNKRSGARIRAVMPMHTFGHPVDLDALIEICAEFKLQLVEDAAESLGSYYKGRHTGTFGRVAALSFNGNKVVTTGGGGAILTDDPELAKLAKHLTTTARVPHQWSFSHDQIGYNYRLPNINAALGCAQLEALPAAIEKKRALADKYMTAFKPIDWLELFREPVFAKSNYWLNALLLKRECAHLRDAVLELTNRHNYMTRPVWTLMHRLPIYADCPRMDLSVAEDIERRLVNLPSSPALAHT